MKPKEITTLAGHRLLPPWVMKLALDVAAAEREACAKVCEGLESAYIKENEQYGCQEDAYYHGKSIGAEDCAAAIRARGNNK